MTHRREFIKKIGLLFSVSPLSFLDVAERKEFKLATLRVAGLQYGELTEETFVSIESLELKREATNIYDKYAIAIYRGYRKVGYIPKENARILASMLDNGVVLRAEVRYFNRQKPVWNRLWVSVWEVG